MTSFMALDGVTSFLRLKDVTITCKRMRRSLSIGGSSSVQWRKVERSGPPRGFGDLGRMAIYFQGAGEHW